MCPEGEYPIAVAYSLDAGSFQWATCSASPDMHEVVAETTVETVMLGRATANYC